jgi:hypothetical protein
MKRILLIHLGTYGDCVMATTIARQIKVDYPRCHLTWCISDKYVGAIINNPDVDAIWEFALQAGETITVGGWDRCKIEANKRKDAGEFDIMFCTQVYPDNVTNFDGTTRSSTFRNYPHPITVPVVPVVRLLPEETARVRAFSEEHRLSSYRHLVLLECSPGSGQSALNLEMGIELAKRITEARDDFAVIITTHLPFIAPNKRVLSGNVFSYRENAALTHYCTLLVGCSSGVSWLGTSTASKQLKTVQFLTRNLGAGFASMAYDFEHWGFPNQHIIENTTTKIDDMVAVVLDALVDFPRAREKHHQKLKPIFWGWLCFINYRKGFCGIIGSWRTMCYFIRRNGVTMTDILDLPSFFWALHGYFAKFVEKYIRISYASKRNKT